MRVDVRNDLALRASLVDGGANLRLLRGVERFLPIVHDLRPCPDLSLVGQINHLLGEHRIEQNLAEDLT